MKGTLYIVGTPIGNMSDITIRAIDILKSVSVIASEDTRVTKNLCGRHEIKTPLLSFHTHSKKISYDKILEILEEGGDVALVSDAGTPGISDPGAKLVQEVLERVPEAKIVPIPGASAITAAYSASGSLSSEFTFLGFLPHKKGRETTFKKIAESEIPVIFYESSHRIVKAIESMLKFSPEKNIVVFREITKMFETNYRGTPEKVLAQMKADKNSEKGEFVVVVN